jgi:hypothetical protein
MTPKPAEASAVRDIYEVLRFAAIRRQPVVATYDGEPRLLCPHVGGRKSGRRNVFCYQFGGRSNTVGLLVPGNGGVWRCLAVEKLSHVELRTGPWHTEARAERQACIDEVDFDSDAQPADDPQNGQ